MVKPVARRSLASTRRRTASLGRVAALALAAAAAAAAASDAARAEEPVDPPACAARAQRWADPASIRLGESVTVTTQVEVDCLDAPAIDVALVVDRSPSMRGAALEDAKAAALAFVAELGEADRAGVVTFASGAEMAARLSRDDRYLGSAIRAIEVPMRGGTDIADGLWIAGRLLTADGDGRPQAIVLISDGRNGTGALPALQAAEVQRAAGRHLVTVALGIQAEVVLMRSMATSPRDALVAPRSADLVDRLRAAAARLTRSGARDVVVDEVPPAAAPYVARSSRPPAEHDGTRLRWRWPLSPPGGVIATHRVRPLAAGRQPAASGGQATFIDGAGRSGSVALPPVWIEVRSSDPTPAGPGEPTPTPLPGTTTATATGTAPPPATAPADRRRIALPALARGDGVPALAPAPRR